MWCDVIYLNNLGAMQLEKKNICFQSQHPCYTVNTLHSILFFFSYKLKLHFLCDSSCLDLDLYLWHFLEGFEGRGHDSQIGSSKRPWHRRRFNTCWVAYLLTIIFVFESLKLDKFRSGVKAKHSFAPCSILEGCVHLHKYKKWKNFKT